MLTKNPALAQYYYAPSEKVDETAVFELGAE